MAVGTKISIAAITAILAAAGYGGYSLIKKSELAALRSGEAELSKVARVIDGDTFELADGDVVRLLGIDAPEAKECYYEESKQALKELIEGKEVELRKDITGSDHFGRLLRYVILPNPAPLESNTLVDEYMVAAGYAALNEAPRDKLYHGLLLETREQAMRKEKGMWGACEYEKAARSQDAVQPASAQCTIKGNIPTDGSGRFYFTEGCNNYSQVKIDPDKGEAYFCTEAEAIKAGFQKAQYCP
ncbi:MAG: hypothetical protein COU11_01715 [Candidatus Harrisonbacteria bacterium CG10_big_fil_rev_8_21_14_0_10_49_15]|uniref:TNase-like domain-containing protein n=1 Tax=Candidatus Harrisonbacteria bacterium CG10_big_fil_rev_8_21_14_0_10_49_15 TaxID=1974587 RepID=A0A2H0UND5_9BACT|nr:MAG: hypothetical protein COU11_01715 [Candidatus Harrisonbacteria bacterium CG10_big_fil_rev_8_21_14_0_10_49_15]